MSSQLATITQQHIAARSALVRDVPALPHAELCAFLELVGVEMRTVAHAAGYVGLDIRSAERLVAHPYIRQTIDLLRDARRARADVDADATISTSKELLQSMCALITNPKTKDADKIRAAELLLRARGELAERHEVVAATMSITELAKKASEILSRQVIDGEP